MPHRSRHKRYHESKDLNPECRVTVSNHTQVQQYVGSTCSMCRVNAKAAAAYWGPSLQFWLGMSVCKRLTAHRPMSGPVGCIVPVALLSLLHLSETLEQFSNNNFKVKQLQLCSKCHCLFSLASVQNTHSEEKKWRRLVLRIQRILNLCSWQLLKGNNFKTHKVTLFMAEN